MPNATEISIALEPCELVHVVHRAQVVRLAVRLERNRRITANGREYRRRTSVTEVEIVAELVHRSRGLKKCRCHEIGAVPQAERDHSVATRQVTLARKTLGNVELGVQRVAGAALQRNGRVKIRSCGAIAFQTGMR